MVTEPALPPATVVVAAHDAAPWVGEAVRSALAQDLAPAEVVVVDDASTDGTAQVVAALDGPVRLLRHPVNRGEAAAKNTGIRAARTPVVVLLDADDTWLPGRLRAVVTALAEHPEVDLVTTDALLVHDGRPLGRWYDEGNPFPWTDQRRALLRGNPVFGHPALRRDAFLATGGFDESLRHATDWDAWIRLVHAGGRLHLVPEPLAVYRLHGTSASADRRAMHRGQVALLEGVLRDLPLDDAERATAVRALAERRRRLAREELKVALRTRRGSAAAAAAVAGDRTQPWRSRAAATAAWVAPPLLRALEERRARAGWVGPGGRRLPHAPSDRGGRRRPPVG